VKTDLTEAPLAPALALMQMEISREDFLYLIERLKPERKLLSYQNKETRIGFDGTQASLEVNDVKVSRPAKGQWKGYVLIPYGQLMAFLKVKPASKIVSLTYDKGRVGIDTTRLPAKWVAL